MNRIWWSDRRKTAGRLLWASFFDLDMTSPLGSLCGRLGKTLHLMWKSSWPFLSRGMKLQRKCEVPLWARSSCVKVKGRVHKHSSPHVRVTKKKVMKIQEVRSLKKTKPPVTPRLCCFCNPLTFHNIWKLLFWNFSLKLEIYKKWLEMWEHC